MEITTLEGTFDLKLSDKEIVELKYMNYLGFKYIARHEIGKVELFKESPVRDKIANGYSHGGYDTWVIGKYPIIDRSLYGDVKIGCYDFITWNNGVWNIEQLLKLSD